MQGREIEIVRGESTQAMPGFAALPAGAERGVVVVHEILGRQPEIDRVIERFAERGYAAVGPDLFHGRRRLACIRQALSMFETGEGPLADGITDARDWLCAEASLAPERVGVIGFCIGGGMALAVAPRFAAVSTNYGDLPKAELLRHSPPIIGCYGGRDRLFGRNGPRLEQLVTPLGVSCETHTFPTVGHSFLTDGHHPLMYALSRPLMGIRWDPEVAEQGWLEIMAFFDRHL